MFPKKVILFLVFLLISLRAFATVFTVTSNADAGTGTLRDALTQAAANGTATTDYIYFNLPDTSAAGRTITILTNLPNVSSNLVIDASTQPGAKFGVSDAKVKIIALLNTNLTVTCCFNISNTNGVGIYALLMDSANLTPSTGGISGIYGVLIHNATIGAPGKGNIMKNMEGISLSSNYDETDSTISQNIKISSNIFDLDEDGETFEYEYGASVFADRVRNLTIGGTTTAEGNIFEGQVVITQDDIDFDIPAGSLLVSNNYFGVDYTGTKPVSNLLTGSALLLSTYTETSVELSNNLFVANSDVGIDNLNCFLKITGNKFGTDITGTQILGTPNFQLVLGYCTGGGIIGGTNPGDGNIFCGAYLNAPSEDQTGIVVNISSPNVQVVGNSFRCNNSTLPYNFTIPGDTTFYAKITGRTANNISGQATPNSRVDLYYSLSCDHCEPEQQFTSVNADANGLWTYSAPLLGDNIIAASTFQGTTSEFTRTSIGTDSVKITNACLGGTGSITGTIPSNVTSLEWVDTLGNVVGTSANLTNVKPGKYRLKATSFGCGDSTSYFQIQNKFQLDTSGIKKLEPSCGNSLGSISGLNIINNDPGAPYTIWQDKNGNPLGYALTLSNVPSGRYYLQVKSADSTCSQIFGPFTLNNVSGPNIDQSKAAIQSTSCGQSTGSITGLVVTGTGTLSYIWWNSQQQKVGTSQDLLNQPAGTYKLEVTDQSQCGPVYTTNLIIPQTNGIMLDETNAQITPAKCTGNNGSVTGIQVTGATQYQWAGATNTVVGTAINLTNVGAGSYTLTASNGFGCTVSSKTYAVPSLPPTKYPVYANTIVMACYQGSNGSVSVTTDTLVASLRWADAQGQTLGTNNALPNLAAGSYQLYLTDKNGCENYYNSYTVGEYPQFIVANDGTAVNDQCTLGTGSISNVQVEGGATPYTYAWYNSSREQIGNGASIANLSAGTYTLTVTDSRCGNASITYTLTNETIAVSPPSVSNVSLCSSGNALITVNNATPSVTYLLYSDNVSTQPVAEQKGGMFNVNITGNTIYYVSQLNGTCESDRVPVTVTVGLSVLNIANTITPNGDGVNDYWVINGINEYPNAEVQVFTRYGNRVFDSKGYNTPFNGTYGGKILPTGVYYYIINLNTNCNLLSGSLTIIR